MNRKVKLLRLLALALMKVEDVVTALSYRVRDYTLSTLADQMQAEEDVLYEEAQAEEDHQCYEWAMRTHYWVEQQNTDAYNSLADELDMEGA